MWWIKEIDGVSFISLEELRDRWGIVAGFSTRLGGVSRTPYDTLNIGLHVGDQPQHVIENRRRLARAVGIDAECMVFADQVHSDSICTVTDSDRGRGVFCRESAVPGTDGLMTASRELVLVMTFADCVPVLLLAPSIPSIALVHAGWKGTAAAISAQAVRLMSRAYGVECSSMHAVVGPAIGPCCYEVSSDVAHRVREASARSNSPLAQAAVRTEADEYQKRSMLDLPGANVEQLTIAGIPADNIAQVRVCTSCRTDLFYSHRAEGNQTGRFAAFAYISPPGYNRTGEEVGEDGVAF